MAQSAPLKPTNQASENRLEQIQELMFDALCDIRAGKAHRHPALFVAYFALAGEKLGIPVADLDRHEYQRSKNQQNSLIEMPSDTY